MADQEELDDSQSPGHEFGSNFESMAALLDKLIMLDYGKQFCSEYKCKPLHRFYFANQTNHAEQFYTFSCLCAWLIKSKARLPTESSFNPQEYEDPHVTIHGILEGLRHVRKDGREEGQLSVEFPPGKLRQGSGPEVIKVLLILADAALDAEAEKRQHSATVTVRGLQQGRDEDEEVVAGDDEDIEINFEEYTLIDEDHEPEPVLITGASADLLGAERPKEILYTDTDEQQWRLEVERVLPKLKVVLRSGAGSDKADWRRHVHELKQLSAQLDQHFQETRTGLDRLTVDISRNVDKIGARERFLQLQLEPLINEYNQIKSQLIQIQDQYRVVSGGVTSKSRQLSDLSDELDRIKVEMEERGSTMTDGTPLISLRKALAKMRAELTSIDIRIGVATHTILQANVAESTQQQLKQRGALGTPVKINRSTLQRLVF